MHLKDQGFKFCISPDKQRSRWIHPVEKNHGHQDWIDVTEWPSEKMVAFLMPKSAQQELFAA
ncbi:hypothetical protein PVE_R1G2215 [Pseudomonas veronii 1YdBTEX2]|uniref:Uncharacterized protein n=1 Tax=Pseudomonas veronii 1YdBTEX2 TaxID=1295141 RepID=A0A1D3JVX0_PSEVE|nr:hypothetical protein [Pseudomonas veronii]SBW80101.1 hypothetical protein PVE_R1G2215 [Pseudomonas veronii 1YdBTEX2]